MQKEQSKVGEEAKSRTNLQKMLSNTGAFLFFEKILIAIEKGCRQKDQRVHCKMAPL